MTLKIKLILLSAALLVGAALLFLLYISEPGKPSIFPPCMFYQLTGFHCPGCGSTRALRAFLHGDIAGGFSMNIFLPVVMVAAPVMIIFPKVALNKYVGWGFAIFAVSYFILRNIPVWPFSLLAPH